MMTNSSFHNLPPLPEYTLQPLPPLLSFIPDKYLLLVLPVIAYWTVSLIFHIIDEFDLFPQYRLHTPAELSKRNHATRWDVLRDVIIQHIIEMIFGFGLAQFDPDPTFGKEQYDISIWAQRIRLAQRGVPLALGLVGIDAGNLAAKYANFHPTTSSILNGGIYPQYTQTVVSNDIGTVTSAFAPWELSVASGIYWYLIPTIQFLIGIVIIDTWQYFWHRGMHMNKWMYNKFHSRHHKLYVPYAYGALYNHPVEGFLLDTLGAGVAYLISGMTVRQTMWFFTGSMIKTVDDHCGYALPFDPLQHITSNNAAFHDIHHQSWGIKTNFSQPFFTFWDAHLKTKWTGEIKLRYEKSRQAAQRQVDRDAGLRAIPDLPPETQNAFAAPLDARSDENAKPVAVPLRRSPRKKASSISSSQGSLKGLRDRVNQTLHGKGGNVLGVESGH